MLISLSIVFNAVKFAEKDSHKNGVSEFLGKKSRILGVQFQMDTSDSFYPFLREEACFIYTVSDRAQCGIIFSVAPNGAVPPFIGPNQWTWKSPFI